MTRVAKRSIAMAGAAVTLAPSWAWAQGAPDADRYWYGHHMMWGGGWGMIFGPIFMILVLAVLIAVVVAIARWFGGPWQQSAPHHPPHRPPPLDILKERFARGEIDKDEFEERRRVLGE